MVAGAKLQMAAYLCPQVADDALSFIKLREDSLITWDESFTGLCQLDVFTQAVKKLAV
jgi:hypothetical protein